MVLFLGVSVIANRARSAHVVFPWVGSVHRKDFEMHKWGDDESSVCVMDKYTLTAWIKDSYKKNNQNCF